MPRLAANLSMLFTEVEFLDRFEAAANCGFEAVEFLFPYDWPADEIADRLTEHGLKQALFNMPPGDWQAGERGLTALPDRRDEFRADLERALAYADALKCPRLHVMAGVVPDELDIAEARATYVDNLRYAATRAAAHGVHILIEPLNTKRDAPGYLLSTVPEASEIIASVAAENLFLQFDLYHAQIMSGDLATLIRAHLGRADHIQIASVPDRHEPDAGEVNYPFLFDLVDGLGYDGWIGCEYRPKAGTEEGLGWAKPYGIAPRDRAT